jgi:hypothetical protein
MAPIPRHVDERFAGVRETAERLYERDENFRDLCDEYQVCAETLARYESDGGKSDAMRREYTALQLRLEGELLRYMDEQRSVSHRSEKA